MPGTMRNLRPIHDQVLLTRVKPEEKLASGIFIPPTAQDKPTEGKVIAVGPGRILENGTRVRPEVEAGCTVLFGKYTGHEVEIDGEKHLIMRESDILAIILKD